MRNNELVSIITITRNPSLSWLRQALESIATQTYDKIESIIIDASDDPIYSKIEFLIEELSGTYALRIKHFRQRSKGLWSAFTEGFEKASGSILGVLNSDDYLNDPDVVTDITESFRRTQISFAFGNSLRVDTNGRPLYLHRPPRPLNTRSIDYYVFCISHHTLYFRKEVLDRVPFSGNSDSAPPDLSFIRQLIKQREPNVYINRTVARFRIHGHNHSRSYSANSTPALFSSWTGLPRALYVPCKIYVSAWSPGYLSFLLKRLIRSGD